MGDLATQISQGVFEEDRKQIVELESQLKFESELRLALSSSFFLSFFSFSFASCLNCPIFQSIDWIISNGARVHVGDVAGSGGGSGPKSHGCKRRLQNKPTSLPQVFLLISLLRLKVHVKLRASFFLYILSFLFFLNVRVKMKLFAEHV